VIVRFINTTTLLLADTDIEAAFEHNADPILAAMCRECGPMDGGRRFDIFLVSAGDMDRYRTAAECAAGNPQGGEREQELEREARDVPGTDVLGYYFHHHPDMHRPAILLRRSKSYIQRCSVPWRSTNWRMP